MDIFKKTLSKLDCVMHRHVSSK